MYPDLIRCDACGKFIWSQAVFAYRGEERIDERVYCHFEGPCPALIFCFILVLLAILEFWSDSQDMGYPRRRVLDSLDAEIVHAQAEVVKPGR